MSKIVQIMPSNGLRAVYGNEDGIEAISILLCLCLAKTDDGQFVAGVELDGFSLTCDTANFLGFLPEGEGIPDPREPADTWGTITLDPGKPF